MASRKRGKNALQNELINFNSFQDAQINALEAISQSLSATLDSNITVRDSLRDISATLDGVAKSLGTATTSLQTRSQVEETTTRDIKKGGSVLTSVMKVLGQEMTKLAKNVAQVANNYSQLSNNMISVSGATGTAVRENRSEIVHDIIAQLNSESGYYFNPEKSYQKMVDIAAGSGIGNLEAIEELTRPMLLATESMNINQNELATILNRWYTRYNFNSSDMEDMVNEIRGNTAGNNATAEATLQNINKFQNFIGIYADSNEEMKNMIEAISSETSRLESVGINSGYIMDYMYQIGTGDKSNASTILSLFANSGSGLNWTTANAMLRSGDADAMIAVSEALSNGAIALGNKFKDSAVTAEALKVYGVDPEEIFNMLSASGVLLTNDEFKQTTEGAQTAIESIDDKFNTVRDKLDNIVSKFSEFFSEWQERTGIGFSDILGVTSLLAGGELLTKVGGKAAKGLGKLVGRGATSSAGGTASGGLFSGLGSSLFAAGGNLVEAGGATLGTGASATVAGTTALGAGSILGGILGAAGLFSGGADIGSAIAGVNLKGDALTNEERESKAWSGGTKLGMVGTGAAAGAAIGSVVPGAGTLVGGLIGAGVGGVGALLGGSKVGDTLHNFCDDLSEETTDLFGDIKDSIKSLKEDSDGLFSGIGKNLKENFVDNIKDIDIFKYAVSPLSIVSDMYTTIGKSALGLEGDHPILSAIYSMFTTGLPSHADGLNYVPRDNYLANLHEGEAIVPKKYNPSANMQEIEAIREQYKLANAESVAQMQEITSLLSDIKEFLSDWKDDNNRRETAQRAASRFSQGSAYAVGYLTT